MATTPHAGETKSSNAPCSSEALAALKDLLSRAYYDHKRAQGKKHNQALIALAPRRCDVIYAMLCDGTLYETKARAAARRKP